MQLNWKMVEDYRKEKPLSVDLCSSPTTVYLNRNVEQLTKTDDEGNEVTYWSCQRAQMSLDEYKEYEEASGIFTTPDFLSLQERLDEQEVVTAEIALNTEYSACLQELSL